MSIASLLLGLAILSFIVARSKRHKFPFPPGPKPWPIIGSLLDMPAVRPWETYRQWCRQYNSDIIHVHLPRESAVILGSVNAAVELLEKRSHIYSDRLRSVVANLAGYDFNILIMPYAAKWRAHRKLFHHFLQPSALGMYMPVQLRHARNFLWRALQSPEKTREHIRLMVAASIAEVVYGKQILSMDDDFIVLAEVGLEGFSKCMIPGVYLVEYFPFLRHIPSWVPGTTVRRIVDKYKPTAIASKDMPYAQIQAAFHAGVPAACIASTMCEEVQSKYGGTEEEMYQHDVAKNVSCLAYTAAIDTSTASAEAFLLAMALFPAVQEKAQAELARVVGPSRLPDFDDLPNLPYLRAVVMETIRWFPVVPFGVPHAVTADDSYKGYRIAKGSVIIPNIWAMLKDPEDYPAPDDFIPERFIDRDGKPTLDVRDPTTIAFGFGRRICPGQLYSWNSMTICAALTLHVFNITAGVNATTGRPADLSCEMVGSLLVRPRDVPCGLTPRSEAAAQLIRDLALEFAA